MLHVVIHLLLDPLSFSTGSLGFPIGHLAFVPMGFHFYIYLLPVTLSQLIKNSLNMTITLIRPLLGKAALSIRFINDLKQPLAKKYGLTSSEDVQINKIKADS